MTAEVVPQVEESELVRLINETRLLLRLDRERRQREGLLKGAAQRCGMSGERHTATGRAAA